MMFTKPTSVKKTNIPSMGSSVDSQSLNSTTTSRRSTILNELQLEEAGLHESVVSFHPKDMTPVMTLGKGSFGRIVLATAQSKSQRVQKQCAVKLLTKHNLTSDYRMRRAETELRILKEVGPQSPYLMHAYEGFQTKDALLLVLPYCSRGDLLFHLVRKVYFTEDQARGIMMQLVLGLEALHKNGVLYRDLKPENVFITSDCRCVLGDFGLSKILPTVVEEQTDKSFKKQIAETTVGKDVKGAFRKIPGMDTITKSFSRIFHKSSSSNQIAKDRLVFAYGSTLSFCGTPAYQSPQVVLREAYGLESDYWSLGVVLYEMLVGDNPFTGKTPKDIQMSILNNNKTFPSDMSTSAQDLIEELLCSDPEERLSDMSELKRHSFFSKWRNPRMTVSWKELESGQARLDNSFLAMDDEKDESGRERCFSEEFTDLPAKASILGNSDENKFRIPGYQFIENEQDTSAFYEIFHEDAEYEKD